MSDLNLPVTQANFDRLPLWLTAAEARWATGFSGEELAAAVKAGEIVSRKNLARRKGCKGNYSKYSKLSIARAAGWKI